jgi:hypothetical protein
VRVERNILRAIWCSVSPSVASLQQRTASSVLRFFKIFSHLHRLHLARTYMERIDREELPPFIWISILFAAEKYSTTNRRFDLKRRNKE